MLRQPTLDLLHELRLSGMARSFDEQTAMPDIAELSFEDRLSLLLEREKAEREQRRYQRLKGHARLHLDAAIEDLNFKAPRGLDRSLHPRRLGPRPPLRSEPPRPARDPRRPLRPARHPARQPGSRRALARHRRRSHLRRRHPRPPPQQRTQDHPQGRVHEEALRLDEDRRWPVDFNPQPTPGSAMDPRSSNVIGMDRNQRSACRNRWSASSEYAARHLRPGVTFSPAVCVTSSAAVDRSCGTVPSCPAVARSADLPGASAARHISFGAA